MTATALEELHKFGFAHLDVRIPNICFADNDDNYIVKLIDLDRSVHEGDDVSGYKGEMYKTQLGWTTSRYDWKQLGLLAAEIILGIDDHSEIVHHHEVDRDECLRMLIKEGRWDPATCRRSANVETHQRQSLKNILNHR